MLKKGLPCRFAENPSKCAFCKYNILVTADRKGQKENPTDLNASVGSHTTLEEPNIADTIALNTLVVHTSEPHDPMNELRESVKTLKSDDTFVSVAQITAPDDTELDKRGVGSSLRRYKHELCDLNKKQLEESAKIKRI